MRIYNVLANKLTLLVLSLLILSNIFIIELYTQAFGQTSSNISNNNGTSFRAQISAGNNVYVVWQDTTTGSGDIYFASSEDDFADFTIVSEENSGSSTFPQIAAIGDNVYVVWQDTTTGSGDIYFVKSNDGGQIFTSAASPLENTAGASSAPQVAIADDNVYVVWQDTTTGSGDIYFKASTDNGDSFGSMINLNSSSGASTVPQIAAIGDNVYVVWQDTTTGSGDIYFRASTDNGATFGNTLILSPSGSISSSIPQIATVENNIYIVWVETSATTEIHFAVSTDFGTSFTTMNLSNNIGASNVPQISAIDTYVYVAWRDTTGLESGNNDIFFKRSTDSGATFDNNPTNLSNRTLNSDVPQVASSGNNVFVIWEDNFLSSTNFETLLAASTDNGETFTDPINISETNTNSRRPQVASLDNMVNAVWDDFISGINTDILAYPDIDYLEATITVETVNNTSPKWQIDTVLATGSTVNADPGDTVTVEWGTGETPSTDITIEEDGSWMAYHNYTISAVNSNPHQIIAKIIDESTSDIEATSDPFEDEINVEGHDTIIELENISSIKQGTGDDITISGTLLDSDTGDGVEAQTITFTGDGTTLFPLDPTVTGPDGSVTFTSEADTEIASDLDVQAHFAGTAEYAASDSNVIIYDIVDPSAVEFDTNIGEDVTVDLSDPAIPADFNASITFDNLLSSGTVFVLECDAPDSSRYEVLQDGCLEISIGAQMELGSFAHIQMGLDEIQIPDGYSIDDIEIFHEETGAIIVDITESKDTDDLTVTGRTDDFSKFILGVGLHEVMPNSAIRQPLYIGQENTVTFRDIENKDNSSSTVTLDDDKYGIGDTAFVTIHDNDGNLDIGAIDSINAQVASETSYPDAITIELSETGINTGVFEGSFNLIEEPSFDNNLEASSVDGITVQYDPWSPSGRLTATVEGVEEAGLFQLSENVEDFDEDDDLGHDFTPVTTPVELELVDSQLGNTGNITVTMTYANSFFADGFLHGTVEAALKVYFKDPILDDWSDVTIDGTLDTDEKTLMGRTTIPGVFVIAYDSFSPGGSNGGLSKPGTGIVLDSIAFVERSNSGHSHAMVEGGSGGGLNVSPGSNVEVNALVEVEGNVQSQIDIVFETLVQGGDITVKTQDISELMDTFLSVADEKGFASIDDSGYTTTGPIYDIDTTQIEFTGLVKVTILYDENQISGPEQDVRLLHYEGSTWQDVTTEIDTNENNVSGKINSTSPVVIAIVDDGTFSDAYFEANPTNKIVVKELVKPTGEIGKEMQISALIKNVQRESQEYTLIVQIIDKNNVSQNIIIQQGQLPRGQETEINVTGIPEIESVYKVQIFTWSGLNRPSALSNVTIKEVNVS